MASSPITVSVFIRSLSRGGAGVGQVDASEADQRVVFVDYAIPGDHLEVEIYRQEKNFRFGRILRWIEKSSEAVEPKCAVFGKCGGCLWQRVPYAKQWLTKVEGVRHALKRTQVGWEGKSFVEFPADQIWNYRNRIQLRDQGLGLGFFRRGSREVVPVLNCEITDSRILKILPELQKEATERVRTNQGAAIKLEVAFTPDGLKSAWNAPHAATGFRQVNEEQNLKLVSFVQDQVNEGSHVLDLYGGYGNLSKGLISKNCSVDCVDSYIPEIEQQKQGGGSPFRLIQSPVLKWLKTRVRDHERGYLPETFSRPVIALLDPPREGLAEEQEGIRAALESLRVVKIVLVGCDTDSFARDVARFLKPKSGRATWALEKLAVLDFFPHTPHVESVAVLNKDF